jgi:hypothetical protein
MLKLRDGTGSIVRQKFCLRPIVLTLAAAPLLAGCSGASDLLSRDAEWFSRPGRVFTKNISIETPPLSPEKPVTPDELISSDGMCPGMGAPPTSGGATAEADPNAPPIRVGVVALGHTECDVARGLGAPDNVSLTNNERGQRMTLLTYNKGPRAGIYTFTAGRLTSIERSPQAAAEPKPTKPPKRQKNAS